MSKTKIAVMGGGTGTFTVLSGLKNYKELELTAIVTSADDGGSNKKFRDEFGLLPPSDFRQCLVALSSDDPKHNTMRNLMMYRFSKGVGLEGQTFGNILIAALTDVEGSQLKAFDEVGKILNIKGKILPITTDDVRLMAEYENGDINYGEHLIDEPSDFHDSKQRIKKLYLNRQAKVYSKAKKELENVDYIILGPGDLYTSTLANVVVGDVPKILQNSKAKIIYIVNLMTKFGQTYNFKASDHIEEIYKYVGKYPEYVILNNSELPKDIIKRYKEEKNDTPVVDDIENGKYKDSKIIRGDIASDHIQEKVKGDALNRSLIRHDSNKLAKIVLKIINK